MKKLILLTLILYGIHAACSAPHSLKYFYTAVTAGIDFPEFTIVGLVDDEQFVYYDSNIRRAIPKAEWIKQNEGADYWDGETQRALGTQQTFKDNMRILMQRFNQTQGVHTVQWMYGCEWDDESGATGGFRQYGYDGGDFLTFDLKNQRYIAPVQQAFISALKWNHIPAQLEHEKQYLTQTCVEWLKKYVSYGRSALERTVAPEVALLQKDSSSPITCHVTGFHPRGVMVTWQRNGEDLDVDVELEETLPHEDGTFQIRSHLRVTPEDWKRDRYTCTVQHKSLKQDITLSVTEDNIKSNKDLETRCVDPEGSAPPMGVIIGVVLGVLLLALAVIGVLIWKKRSSGYGKTSSTDSDSAYSDPPADRKSSGLSASSDDSTDSQSHLKKRTLWSIDRDPANSDPPAVRISPTSSIDSANSDPPADRISQTSSIDRSSSASSYGSADSQSPLITS